MQISKKTYFFRMLLCLTVLSLAVTAAIAIQVYAAPTEAVKSNISDFNNLSGEAGYIQNKYDGCYTLDIEETGLFDTGYSIINSIANMLFSFIKWLARATTSLFYFCMTLDIAELFQDEINTIQEALNSGIFQPLFVLAFCFTALVLLKKFMKRDLMGAYGQIAKVIFLVILSILVVRDSSTVLSYATGITKSISTAALTGVNNQSSTGNFGADSAGVLWINLVHQPWITIEFGSDQGIEDEIAKFMDPNADREELVKRYMEVEGRSAFNKKRAGEKVGFMFLYLIPFLMKCVIYIVISMIQLVFQLLGVFYILLAPVILILSMIPGYDGMLGSWVRKILESQLSILIITFLMGLLIKFDGLLYGKAPEFGWLVVMLIQVVVSIGVVFKRNAIFGALSKMQKGISNSGYAVAAMKRSGDINVQNGIRNAQMAYRHTKRNIRKMKSGAIAASERIEESVLGKTASYWGDKINANWEAKKNGTLLPKEEAAAKQFFANEVHINTKTGEYVSRPVFENMQAEKKANQEKRAERRWQAKVAAYGSKPVKAPRLAKTALEEKISVGMENGKIVAFNSPVEASEEKVQRPVMVEKEKKQYNTQKTDKKATENVNKNKTIVVTDNVPGADRKTLATEKQGAVVKAQKTSREVEVKRPRLSISNQQQVEIRQNVHLQQSRSAEDLNRQIEQKALKQRKQIK